MSKRLSASLQRLGLLPAGAEVQPTRLTGGVSSDIWKVELPMGTACVKRALTKLRVEQDWFAPVERNAFEVDWMITAARAVPEAVPKVLAHDAEAGLFVMEYLAPGDHPVWKTLLRDGTAEPSTARAVAQRMARIHSATAGNPMIAKRFTTDPIFYSIRLEPYLQAAGQAHPDLAGVLQTLITVTSTTKKALVHGDISPKNILIGPKGPVFLDAECAWYGDPAFDLAFCLNHLLLKCLWRPAYAKAYVSCFEALTDTYLTSVDWEQRSAVEERAAQLLPGLLLARIDGKSPVEYLTADSDKDRVRRVARSLLLQPVAKLINVRQAWTEELAL